MSDRILVDTCVWLEFFNLQSVLGKTLEHLLIADSVATCGIVLFELMQGIKTEKEISLIRSVLSQLPYMEMNRSLWEKAAILSSSLRKKGIAIPLSDIFIATIALEHNLSIFTIDKHFESIQGISIYKPCNSLTAFHCL